jgi:hypothetical protein
MSTLIKTTLELLKIDDFKDISGLKLPSHVLFIKML